MAEDGSHTVNSIKYLNQTVSGGLALIGVGLIALIATRNLDFGTLAEIGPGLFPRVFAICLMGLGAVMVTMGYFENRQGTGIALETWTFRPIFGILGGIVLFGLLIRGFSLGPVSIPALGLVCAAPLAMLFSGLADRQTKWRDLAVLAVVITALTVALFRFALGLSIPVAPWLIGY
jgi:hypothetical protein